MVIANAANAPIETTENEQRNEDEVPVKKVGAVQVALPIAVIGRLVLVADPVGRAVRVCVVLVVGDRSETVHLATAIAGMPTDVAMKQVVNIRNEMIVSRIVTQPTEITVRVAEVAVRRTEVPTVVKNSPVK